MRTTKEISIYEIKVKKESNCLPIHMVGNNEVAQVMKMLERMQAGIDVSEKKVELLPLPSKTLSRTP